MLEEQGVGTATHAAAQTMKKSWSPPRVILSEDAGEGTESAVGNGADGGGASASLS